MWYRAFSKGPCAQIIYTLAPKCLCRDYFKAKVYYVGTWTLRVFGAKHGRNFVRVSQGLSAYTSLRRLFFAVTSAHTIVGLHMIVASLVIFRIWVYDSVGFMLMLCGRRRGEEAAFSRVCLLGLSV